MKDIDFAFEAHKLKARSGLKISCVISALNEGPRIGKVLEVVINFPLFDEIVVVNDGSTDNTLEVIKYFETRSNKVKAIDLKQNVGKTKGIKTGVESSTGDILALLDGDLVGLKFDYLYKMLYFVLSKEFDMTILDRGSDRETPLGWSQSWTARFNGGERALWRNDYMKIPFGKNSRYAIEQEMNLYFVNHGLKVRTIYCPDLKAITHLEKDGFLVGLKVYMNMFKELYKHSKVKGFYYQVENIVEDRIEPLYELMDRSPVKKPVMGAIVVAGLVTSVATFLWLNLRKGIKNK